MGVAVGMGIFLLRARLMDMVVGRRMAVVMLEFVFVGHFLPSRKSGCFSLPQCAGLCNPRRGMSHRRIFWLVPSTSDTSFTVTKARGSMSRRIFFTWGI